MEGLVTKTTGSWLTVRKGDGTLINCKLKGQFRIKGIKTTNPVAAGDKVEFILQPGDEIGLVNNILERKNYIIRKATNLSKVSHIIAANIDHAYLVVTMAMPRTSTGFIDRFLVTAEAYHIPAGLIFNKTDIYDEPITKLHEKLFKIYREIGYPCYAVSALNGDGLDLLGKVLKNKINLFSGHSGVGKSELINKLIPGLNIKTAEISYYHEKGKHTTTFAEMFEIPGGGFIVDTPGIKEFGLIDFDKQEVSERFPEMRALMHACQYHNCSHIHEPKCAVKKALEEGKISNSRYRNYLSIIHHDEWHEEY